MIIAIPCPFCRTGKLMVVDGMIYPESDEPEMSLTQTLFGVKQWFVVCECGAQGPQADSKDAAVEAWNERKSW